MEMLLVWLDAKTHRRPGRFTTTGPCGHSCGENPVHHLVFETGTRRYQKSWVTPAGLRNYKNKSNTPKETLGSEHPGQACLCGYRVRASSRLACPAAALQNGFLSFPD